MGFGGGSTSDIGDPRSGEATYAGTGSRAGTASRSGTTNYRSAGPSTQRDDDSGGESTRELAQRLAAERAAEQAAVMQQVEEARIRQEAGGPQRMGFVKQPTFSAPGVNFSNAQLMRPFASGFLQPNLTMGMMTSSGVKGIGQIPKAPVYNPATNTYTIDGQIIDNATAEYIMDVRGDVYGAVADPSAGLLGGFANKLGQMLTGQADPVQGLGNYGKLLNMGGEIDPATGDIETKVGKGTLNYNNRLGIVTYSGPPDPNYEGEFEQLVRGPFSSDDGDDTPAVPVTAITPAEEPVAAAVTPQYIRPAGGFFPEEGLYYRRGLLDEPVPGLLDFTARNRAFRRGMATDASLYQMPYDLTGYTLL
ncbi:hypothetical protein FAMCQIZV_CDS0019 [Phage C72C1]|nr:hypothetical protein FAMCQIZV_CDS0019 [Phage C72C1]